MKIDLFQKYILTLWEGRADWKELFKLFGACVAQNFPRAEDAFFLSTDGIEAELVRAANVLDSYKADSPYCFNQPQDFELWDAITHIEDKNVIGAIEATGQQLKSLACWMYAHPFIGELTEETWHNIPTPYLVEGMARNRVFSRQQLHSGYALYAEGNECFEIATSAIVCADDAKTFKGVGLCGLSLISSADVFYMNREVLAFLSGTLKRKNYLENLKKQLFDCECAYTLAHTERDRFQHKCENTPQTAERAGGEDVRAHYQQTAKVLILETVKPLLKHIKDKDYFKTPGELRITNISATKKQNGLRFDGDEVSFTDADGVTYGYFIGGSCKVESGCCWVQMKKGGDHYILIEAKYKDFYNRLKQIAQNVKELS